MAKIGLTKLGLKVNQDIKNVEFNGQIIEVKQYLPINEKLELISNVINASADDKNYANPVKIDVFTAFEIFDFYTNINFTEKQREDIPKLYDMLVSSGLYAATVNAIPAAELKVITEGIEKSIKAVYDYKTSLLGIFETISTDYSQMSMDADDIYHKIADPDNLTLLKDVMTKLG
jgi:hypothetical protein